MVVQKQEIIADRRFGLKFDVILPSSNLKMKLYLKRTNFFALSFTGGSIYESERVLQSYLDLFLRQLCNYCKCSQYFLFICFGLRMVSGD